MRKFITLWVYGPLFFAIFGPLIAWFPLLLHPIGWAYIPFIYASGAIPAGMAGLIHVIGLSFTLSRTNFFANAGSGKPVLFGLIMGAVAGIIAMVIMAMASDYPWRRIVMGVVPGMLCGGIFTYRAVRIFSPNHLLQRMQTLTGLHR